MFKKDNNLLFPISLLLFVIVVLYLLKIKQYQIGILCYILYTGTLYMLDKRYMVSFFVFNLPLLQIIPTDFKIFSIVGPHEIVYGFSLLTLIFYDKKANYKEFNKYQKIAIKFIYFLFFIKCFVLIKDIVLGLEKDTDKQSFLYVFKNVFRYFLYYYSLVLLIKNIAYEKLYKDVIVGMQWSIVFLVISMLFSKELILLGADIAKKELFLKNLGVNTRFVGFYGAGGDENSAGVFLSSFFGFMLALIEKTKNTKRYIVFLGFAVLGVLLTGSRTSFISLLLVILLFLLLNNSGSLKSALFVAIFLFCIIFSEKLQLVIDRFFDESAKKAIDSDQMGRVGKWIYYLGWIFDNMETLIIGNQKDIPYNRAPHNYFIYLLYHSGIFVLLYFVKLFVSLLKMMSIKMKKYDLRIIYFVIPFPLLIMTVNSFGSSIYLWIYLSLSVAISHEITTNNLKTN